MRQHVLDANALYRYLTGGEGAEIVARLLKEAVATSTPVVMSAVNWGEVYYTLVKRVGISKADKIMHQVREDTPVHPVVVDGDFAVKAALIKAQYNVPYADCFAAALAGTQHVLVTSDHEHLGRVPTIRLLKLPSRKCRN